MSKPYYQNKKLVRPAAVPIATVNIRSDGGGLRKGFGTLLKPEAFDEVAAEKAVKNHIEQIGDVDLDDLRPSISSEEVQPEALKKDYDRTKSFLQSFLKEPSVLVNPFSGKDAEESRPRKPVKEKKQRDKERDRERDKEKPKEKPKEVEKSKEKPKEVEKPKEKGKKPLKLSISSEAVKRRDPEAGVESAASVKPDAEQKVKGPIRSLGSIVASLNGADAGGESHMAHSSRVSESRANVGQLKNIFYKDHGVDWSDTMVSGGSQTNVKVYDNTGGKDSASDALFREAELVGYDIRNAAGGNADGGGADAPGENFSFGFFQPEPETQAETVGMGTSKVDVKPSARAAAAAPSSSAAVGKERDASEGSRRVQNTMKVPYSERDRDGQPRHYKAVPMPNTLEILKRAKRFCRERPTEVIADEWKEVREKMVLDYKKKRKDALRNIKKRKLQYQYKK